MIAIKLTLGLWFFVSKEKYEILELYQREIFEVIDYIL